MHAPLRLGAVGFPVRLSTKPNLPGSSGADDQFGWGSASSRHLPSREPSWEDVGWTYGGSVANGP